MPSAVGSVVPFHALCRHVGEAFKVFHTQSRSGEVECVSGS